MRKLYERRRWEGSGPTEARCRRRILRMIRVNKGRPVPLARIVATMQTPAVHGMFAPAVTRTVVAGLLADAVLRRCGDRLLENHLTHRKLLRELRIAARIARPRPAGADLVAGVADDAAG